MDNFAWVAKPLFGYQALHKRILTVLKAVIDMHATVESAYTVKSS